MADPIAWEREAIHDGMTIEVGFDAAGFLLIRVGDRDGYDPIANVEAGADRRVAKAIHAALGRALSPSGATATAPSPGPPWCRWRAGGCLGAATLTIETERVYFSDAVSRFPICAPCAAVHDGTRGYPKARSLGPLETDPCSACEDGVQRRADDEGNDVEAPCDECHGTEGGRHG